MFSIQDKRQDIRFTKQISVAYILEKRDFDLGGGVKNGWVGEGGTMGAGGFIDKAILKGSLVL
jgi:hypothetical protein